MADPASGERLADWARSAHTWLLLRPVSRGFWAVAAVFLVGTAVANAADGNWLSAVFGVLLAGVAGSRLWALRGTGEDRPPSGQARTASR
ncbi:MULTISPECIES: hypothetical protein [unclassified Modestobacter]|uniref:hypothetical protein n=1 Tax=unclassified Modestobacter TaxID=2643866 RepID=UPI0022AAE7D1|nr:MULTISPECIES: hypothetical protein [unclassified Modestobacter]MCZ2827057.1 hypothetical protein [Modestobacter sp. VKM Ac-2981]MCZ2855248.1 hypothetical protein [Modestobacter sp. VKM Ac-2982]